MTEKTRQQKNIPMRTCIATGQKFPKRELVRIVFNPNTAQLEVDIKNKVRARGANLSASLEAFELMVKKKSLPRALRLEKNLSQQDYEALKDKFIVALEERNFRPNNKAVKIRISNQVPSHL
jgi:uncharacterized protein